MSYEFELDHKKTTILVGVFCLLLFLVFIAGWLSGALFGIPDGDIRLSKEPMPRTPPMERPGVVAGKIKLPPPPDPAPDPAPEKAFSVQVGSFRTAGKARALGLALVGKGYSPYVYRGLNSKGQAWFTVRIGDHADYAEAVSVAEAFGEKEAAAAVVTHIDTLSVVRTPDGSLPADRRVLDTGERIDLDEIPESPAPAPVETPEIFDDGGDAVPFDPGDAGAAGDEATTALTVPSDEAAGDGATTALTVPSDEAAGDGATTALTVLSDEAAGTGAFATDTAAVTGGGMDRPNKFSVQAGAFLNPKNAHRLADKLRERGYAAYVFDVEDAAGKTWHAVRADDYPDLKAAIAAGRAFQEKEAIPVLVTHIDSLTVAAVPGGSLANEGPGAVGRATYTPSGRGGCTHSLRLASFRSHEAAVQAVSVYRRQGLPAFFFTLADRQGEDFRLVQMGCYDSFLAARAARAEFRIPGAVIKKTPWANLVGAYAERTAADQKVLELEAAGFSPYVKEAADGSYKVMAGAFSSRETAETYGRTLGEQGIHNTVVAR